MAPKACVMTGRLTCPPYSVLLLFTISLVVTTVCSEKILFFLPLSSKSHKNFFEPLIHTLSKRGHELTVLSNEKTMHPPWNNYSVTELVAVSSEELLEEYPDPFESAKKGKSNMAFPFQFVLRGCHKVIQSETFQNVMKMSKSPQGFDLIFVDSFLSNCFDGFIYESGTPFILVTTMPAPSYISERLGNFLPPSIVPVLSFRGYSETNGGMCFWGRVRNFLHFVLARMYVNYFIIPNLEKVYREYLGELTPGIFEIEEEAKMIFMNSHHSINFPRPLLPSVVEVGGIHCRDASPLTNQDLANFISKQASPNGFIYFSTGSILKLNNAPDEIIHTLLSAFSKLSLRVVMKWTKGWKSRLTNKIIPDNVWIDEWFPQQDILGHENIRLFISHGGLLSMQEAVYHAVPVLGLPFGMDQDTNVHSAVLQGYAMKLDFNQLTDTTLSVSLQQILNDSSFSKNVQRISKSFRRRQSSPLETAVYWTEHVLGTIGDDMADLMQSPARKLNILQYYSCDILLFLLFILVIATGIIYVTIKILAKRIRNLVTVAEERISQQKSKFDAKISKKFQ